MLYMLTALSFLSKLYTKLSQIPSAYKNVLINLFNSMHVYNHKIVFAMFPIRNNDRLRCRGMIKLS